MRKHALTCIPAHPTQPNPTPPTPPITYHTPPNPAAPRQDLTITCASTADLSPAACPQQPPTLLNVSSVDDFLGALRLVEAADLPACTQHQTVLRLTRNITLDVARWPQVRAGAAARGAAGRGCGAGRRGGAAGRGGGEGLWGGAGGC